MNRRLASAIVMWFGITVAATAQVQAPQSAAPVVIASKPFGESYLLAEMFAQLLERHGLQVKRIRGLGSTEIIFQAMRRGDVDVYPEYTGTGLIAILQDTLPAEEMADPRRVFAHVSEAFATRYGVRWLPPLGFENTFALAIRADTARQYNLRTLTDLARESSKLRAGFTPDFVERSDGLPGLMRAYGESIRPRTVTPLLPALKYQALVESAVDVIDGFSTDGLLARYNLVVLQDDQRFFPPYEAAAVLGKQAAARADVVSVLTLLSAKLSEPAMRALNRRVEVDGEDVRQVAATALDAAGLSATRSSAKAGGAPVALTPADGRADESFGAYVWARRASLAQLTLRHLWLVTLALAAAVVIAVPLGLALERARTVSGPALGALGVIQTIPSIALLAFMVPFLGVGVVPALIALWLYALFPIARGTFTGVRDADPDAVEAAEALGMTPQQRLLRVRLPLAAPVIMAGVRTAGVITVGATTLAAFIGAGGLGEPIVTGLALADTKMVLFGAVPAAALAVVVDGILALVEKWFRPAHLRRTVTVAIIAWLVIAPATLSAQRAAHSCVVVSDNGGTPQQWNGSAADCSTRLSPASTYKIPHALIGLETGAITETTVEKWDGVKHPDQPKWNLDHTVFSAMKPSVLWFFQRMAPRIGAERAHEWLQRFAYGNADTSGPITMYWVNGRLRISPAEQLAFLTKFYGGTLPVKKIYVDHLQEAMRQAPGTVENARGVHKLEARWRNGITLDSKTGASTIESGESVSWLVGQLTIDDRKLTFASAVWRAKGGVDTLDATHLAIRTFVDRGVLQKATR